LHALLYFLQAPSLINNPVYVLIRHCTGVKFLLYSSQPLISLIYVALRFGDVAIKDFLSPALPPIAALV